MTVQELAQRLVQFRSTHDDPEQLQACLDFCVQFFGGTPAVVKQYEHEAIRSVVIQTQDTTEVDVLLLGHIDTIHGPDELFAGRIEYGKLYGRGTLDMKAFVATSMVVLKQLLDDGYKGNIALAIVTDEEMGGVHGARHLVEDVGYHAKVVLVPDDGEHINRIVVESKRILHLRFVAEGVEAHASRPWMGRNAIGQLLKTYDVLGAHFTHYTEPPKDLWVNTINLGTISGGSATNEIPGHAEMTVDVRLTPDVSRETALQWIEQSLQEGVSYSVVMEGYPTVINKDDPMVQQYVDVVHRVTGAPVQFIKNGGGTDGRYFSHAGMTVIVHQGTGGFCQSDREHVELEGLDQLVNIHAQFIRAVFPSS